MKKIEIVECEMTFQGAWKVTMIIGGVGVEIRQYFNYTKKEALDKARAEAKELIRIAVNQ
jgi:hypothetical protein